MIVDIHAPKPKEVADMQAPKEEKKELTPGERIIEARVRGEETRATIEGLGGHAAEAGGSKAGSSAEAEAMKFAKEALQMQSATIKSVEEARKVTQDALTQAEAEKNKALTQLFTHQLTTIEAAETRVKDASEKAAGGSGPKSQMEVYREVKTVVDELVKDTAPKPGDAHAGTDASVSMKLQEMAQNHEIAMENIRLILAQQNNDFSLKMAQFTEEKKRMDREYEDTKDFRNRGLEGFEDLITSLSAGITSEREAGEAPGESKVKASASKGKGQKEVVLETTITQFPCDHCNTMIGVEEGQSNVVCPSCGTGFDIQLRVE